jgi:uncharacterized protein YjfI (DUF2170 family)
MYKDELVRKALLTQDPIVLFKLFEQAIDMVTSAEGSLAFTKKREADLRAQVERQKKMIENLEATLWGKPK